MGVLSSQDSLWLKDILLKINNQSERVNFSEFMSQVDLNQISEKVRPQAQAMLEKAFEEKNRLQDSASPSDN